MHNKIGESEKDETTSTERVCTTGAFLLQQFAKWSIIYLLLGDLA